MTHYHGNTVIFFIPVFSSAYRKPVSFASENRLIHFLFEIYLRYSVLYQIAHFFVRGNIIRYFVDVKFYIVNRSVCKQSAVFVIKRHLAVQKCGVYFKINTFTIIVLLYGTGFINFVSCELVTPKI